MTGGESVSSSPTRDPPGDQQYGINPQPSSCFPSSDRRHLQFVLDFLHGFPRVLHDCLYFLLHLVTYLLLVRSFSGRRSDSSRPDSGAARAIEGRQRGGTLRPRRRRDTLDSRGRC